MLHINCSFFFAFTTSAYEVLVLFLTNFIQNKITQQFSEYLRLIIITILFQKIHHIKRTQLHMINMITWNFFFIQIEIISAVNSITLHDLFVFVENWTKAKSGNGNS